MAGSESSCSISPDGLNTSDAIAADGDVWFLPLCDGFTNRKRSYYWSEWIMQFSWLTDPAMFSGCRGDRPGRMVYRSFRLRYLSRIRPILQLQRHRLWTRPLLSRNFCLKLNYSSVYQGDFVGGASLILMARLSRGWQLLFFLSSLWLRYHL